MGMEDICRLIDEQRYCTMLASQLSLSNAIVYNTFERVRMLELLLDIVTTDSLMPILQPTK